ncbi:MAG: STAS domain-containing protein [Cyanobacteriota bacterium]
MSSAVKVVQPSGILDGIRGNQLRRDISDVVASGANTVLIDLQDVTFMDSSGLSSLISAQRMVRTAGGKLFLCSINDQAQMLFELTKMNRVFEIFADQEEFNSKIGAS